jgi:lipopolysaccharide export system protein LptA
MRVAFGLMLSAVACMGEAYSQVQSQVTLSDAPIYVRSETGQVLDKECRGLFFGDVVATQGDAQLTSDKLTLVGSRPAGRDAGCETDRLIAEANVFYITPKLRIRADRAEYDQTSEVITFTGEVILRNTEGSVIRGTSLVYSLREEKARITAGDKPIEMIIPPSGRSRSASN